MTRATAAVIGILSLLTGSAAFCVADPVDVSPLLTDRTAALARVDVGQLKLRALADWVTDTARRAGLDGQQLTQVQQGGAALALLGQPSVDGLKRAGVTEIALLMQFDADVTQTPSLLIAVPRPANPNAVVQALAPANMRHGEAGNLIVFSPNLPPGTLAKLKPTPRPDLTDSVADRRGAAAVAVIGLSDALKAESLKARPAGLANPNEPAMLESNVRQYALRIETAAGPKMTASARTVSPEAAVALKDWLTQPREPGFGKVWGDIARTMPLVVSGPAVTLEAGQNEIDSAARDLLPHLLNAKVAADRINGN